MFLFTPDLPKADPTSRRECVWAGEVTSAVSQGHAGTMLLSSDLGLCAPNSPPWVTRVSPVTPSSASFGLQAALAS